MTVFFLTSCQCAQLTVVVAVSQSGPVAHNFQLNRTFSQCVSVRETVLPRRRLKLYKNMHVAG